MDFLSIDVVEGLRSVFQKGGEKDGVGEWYLCGHLASQIDSECFP